MAINGITNFVVEPETETSVKVSFQTTKTFTKLWYSTTDGMFFREIPYSLGDRGIFSPSQKRPCNG